MKLPNFKLRNKYCKYISECKKLDNFVVTLLQLFDKRKVIVGEVHESPNNLKVRFSPTIGDYPVEIQPEVRTIYNYFRYQTYPWLQVNINSSHWIIQIPELIRIHKILKWTIKDYDKLISELDNNYLNQFK